MSIRLSATLALRVLIALSALPFAACRCGDEPLALTLHFEAFNDVDEALEGVAIQLNKSALGKTEKTGSLETNIQGVQGSRATLHAECPDGYQATQPDKEVRFSAFQQADGKQKAPRLNFRVVCKPLKRTTIVVINTHRKAVMPIWIDGKAASQTNTDGIAHLSFVKSPGESFEIQLRTDADPTLRPQNPTKQFSVEDRDQLLMLDQPFDVAVAKKKVRRAARKGPIKLPMRIQ